MRIANRIFIIIALMACVIPASGAASAHPDSDLPDASSVVTRVLERAAQVARNTNAAPYIYDKRSLVEELDATGQSIKATEKIYRVVFVQGLPFSRVHLGEPFSIGWLGIIASIHQCDLAVQRQRLPDGYWVNLKHTVFLVGRKLLSPMRYRTTEASSSFCKKRPVGITALPCA